LKPWASRNLATGGQAAAPRRRGEFLRRTAQRHARVELDTNLLHYSEITCKASFHHTPGLIRKALDIIAAAAYVGRRIS
jgi:acyl dehydratase